MPNGCTAYRPGLLALVNYDAVEHHEYDVNLGVDDAITRTLMPQQIISPTAWPHVSATLVEVHTELEQVILVRLARHYDLLPAST